MKKRIYFCTTVLLVLILTLVLLVACNPDNGEQNDGKYETQYFTVTFDTQGGSGISDITVGNGQVIGELTLPTKQCSSLVGFALDAGGERMWDVLADKVSANITLYAIWEDAHDWGEWTVTMPATCAEDGERTRICSECSETEREVIPAEHTWGEWATIAEPTCTADGTQKRVCEVCGKEETGIIPTLGHDFEEGYTVDIAPSCETTGSESRHCTRCDATTDNHEISALGHDYDGEEWLYNDANHWKYCARCGKKSEEDPHLYDSEYICECGMVEETPVSEFQFMPYGSNGTGLLVEYTGSRTNVSIPLICDYGEVVAISHNAFKGHTKLKSVIIPYGVTSIGDNAFQYCVRLTSITIPDSVTSIGENAFSSCESLTSITIPDSVTSIGRHAFDGTAWNDAQPDGLVYAGKFAYAYKGTMPSGASISIKEGTLGIADGAFAGYRDLTSVTIPDSVTSIGDSAFYACSGMTSVTIGSGVTSIGREAFSLCESLTSVTIPDSVTSIGVSAFLGCVNLTEILWNIVYVERGQISSSIFLYAGMAGSGIALTFGEDVKEIPEGVFSACVGLTSVSIPYGVTSIGGHAFDSCQRLISIIIPDSVTSIGENAFSYCGSLTSITIPDSVTSIGRDAFYGTAWYNSQPDGLVYAGKVAYKYKGTMPSGTSISIKEGTLNIVDGAFAGYRDLTSVIIPDSVTNIGYQAFSDCSGLTSVTIPDSVTSIGGSAFYGTAWYNSQPDGVVYAGKVAYAYKGTMTGNTSIVLEEGTLGIADYAFAGDRDLKSVIIPDSVTSIGDSAFYDCSGMTSVTIGCGVTKIGIIAFYKCTALTLVKFNGTMSQWADVINEGLWSEGCSFTEVVCSDGTVKL